MMIRWPFSRHKENPVIRNCNVPGAVRDCAPGKGEGHWDECPQETRVACEQRLIDPVQQEALAEALGPDGMQTLIRTYWQDATHLLDVIIEAVGTPDRVKLDRAMHTLKGASLNVGYMAIAMRAGVLRQRVNAWTFPVEREDVMALMADFQDTWLEQCRRMPMNVEVQLKWSEDTQKAG